MFRSIRNARVSTILVYFVVSIFLLQACGLNDQPVQTSTAVPIATNQAVTTPTEAEVTLQPTPSPKSLLATPTPALVISACLPSNTGASLGTDSLADLPQSILGFLNAGGTPESLDQALYAAGIANQPTAVASADLTGDGKIDIAVSVFDPASQLTPPAGQLLIFICSRDQYSLVYQQASASGESAPGIRYVKDLDADGKADLVTSAATCGASTCFEAVQILSWNGDTFANRLQGTTMDLPYPDITLSGPDETGRFKLQVAGSGFGSVGAGPTRDVTRIFSLDTTTMNWTQGADILGPSNYRIHVLQDADAAARSGDYDTALQLYGRVVNDTTLDDWADPEKERADLAAYALFRTIVVYELQNKVELAQTTFDQLKTSVPEVSAQYGYVQLAEAFLQGYAEGGVPAGCGSAQVFASQNEEQILLPLSMGYGNPAYTAKDICPFK